MSFQVIHVKKKFFSAKMSTLLIELKLEVNVRNSQGHQEQLSFNGPFGGTAHPILAIHTLLTFDYKQEPP